jgi:hypothetical protein
MKTLDVLAKTKIEENCGCTVSMKPELDHEVQMARSELYRAANSAMELHKMLKQVSERQGIEGWVAAKITKAADYLESVYHYLDYEMRFGDETVEEQAIVGAPGQPSATTTPGMVKMAKLGPDGKPIGTPVFVQSAQIKQKQQQGFKVIGESASSGASTAGGIASNATGFANGGIGMQKRKKKVSEADVDEGFVDSLKKGVKNIKRGMKGWSGDQDLPLTGKANNPKDIVSRVRSSDDEFLKKISKQDAAPHSPAGLQKASANQELKRRSKKTESWDATVQSIPRTEPFKHKKIVVISPKGKEWTFNTENEARRMFPDHWNKIKSGQLGYKVTGLDETSTGPKFTGYYKGTDKGRPGKKMVGSE